MISNQTRLYISVSLKPGNFGATIYNRLFQQRDINAVYLPRRAPDPETLIGSIRALGISGCSVSMPLKGEVGRHLDELVGEAAVLNSVNTIVNEEGRLTGHTTDYFGASTVLNELKPRSAILHGYGSVSGSVGLGLIKNGCETIAVVGRNPDRAGAMVELLKKVAQKENARCDIHAGASAESCDLLINATPAGTDSMDPVLGEYLDRAAALFDLVVSPRDTALVAEAKARGKRTVAGMEMSKYQLQRQFQLYTGIEVEMAEIDAIIAESFREK